MVSSGYENTNGMTVPIDEVYYCRLLGQLFHQPPYRCQLAILLHGLHQPD